MKKMTCREMGGVCDEAIEADTAEEMTQKGHDHVAQATDPDHIKLKEDMDASGEEGMAKWKEEFRKKWEEAPDA